LGGILDVDSADKAARFIQICDAFNIPLVFLQDVPGFMVGSKAAATSSGIRTDRTSGPATGFARPKAASPLSLRRCSQSGST